MPKQTEILCIMDRSGSMASITKEAVGAFNQFLKDQKKLPGKAKLTLAIFDDRYEVIHDRVDLKDVPKLTEDTVSPRGMTALNDAIGKTITSAKKIKKTICLIQTDGHENASKEYNGAQVRDLIKEKEKDGWEFTFVGAGIDAIAVGCAYGIAKDKCVSVDRSADGMRKFSASIGASTTAYRSG